MAKRKNIYFVTMKFENIEYGTQTKVCLLIKAESLIEARSNAPITYLYDYTTESFREKNNLISCDVIEFNDKDMHMIIPNYMIS